MEKSDVIDLSPIFSMICLNYSNCSTFIILELDEFYNIIKPITRKLFIK
jgi:hypothetical protein